MVRWYWQNNASRIIFGFDGVSGSDYSEIWSEDAASAYHPTLSINYSVQSAPTAPTLSAPAAGSSQTSQTPTFSWVHNDPQGDAQAQAKVKLWDAAGTTLLYTWNVPSATQSLVAPVALTRGTTYQFCVQTSDAAVGFGPYSAKQSFSVAALPVVTVDATRRMTFDQPNAQPRLVVQWTSDQAQSSYRVQTASGYDSGTQPGGAQSHTVARNLTNGTAEAVTVTVTANNGLVGQASQSFTPRWGLTTHRRDLGAAPVNWGVPVVASTVPAGASLVIEYGSGAAGAGAPEPWYPTLGAAPKAQVVFWRAWFIPSATAGPSLDTISIPSDATAQAIDKWITFGQAGLTAPWSISTGDYVYGSRSVACDGNGVANYLTSATVRLRAGRAYIISGSIKSTGNSGACYRLMTPGGNGLTNAGGELMTTPPVGGTISWLTADQRAVNRYRSPVYTAPADMDVQVWCVVTGAGGTKAWFDAVKLEESTVATPWQPGEVGATVVDAGGVQVDASKGGVLRYRGTAGGIRDLVQGGANGLVFGGDLNLFSPVAGSLETDGHVIGGRNLVRNGSFEYGRTGWSALGTSNDPTVATDDYLDGYQSLKFIAGSFGYIGQTVRLKAGRRYVGSFWMKGAGFSSTAGAGIVHEGLNMAAGGTNGVLVTSVPNVWTKYSYSFVAATDHSPNVLVTNSYGGTSAGSPG